MMLRQNFYQKGLSLVELMISLSVGSVITLGCVQLFSSNSETYKLMMGQSRMQESSRFALDFIADSVQRAGYRGCFSNNEQLYWTIGDADDLPYEYDLRFGVQGYDASGEDLWSPTLADLDTVYVADTEIDTDAVVSGTDVLTLRNLQQRDIEMRLSDPMASSQDDVLLVAPAGGMSELGFGADEFAVIHDCEKATIFLVTGINDTENAPSITIEHDTDDVHVRRNTFMTLAIRNSFGDDAMMSAIESHTFYIAPGEGENNNGNNPMSLWRKSGITAPVELVEGVEDLQILYGVSTDGDSTPNQYVVANFVADWKEVTTIRLSVVVNSVDDVGAFSTPTHGCEIQFCYDGEVFDGLSRRSFTQTIMLRNSS
jgi:type IV pilus assembly protein PilW